jgi:nucleotide-binding universal stress UspA family protein
MSFANILCATDLSEASQAACQRAIELARQCGGTLTILHTYADPTTVAEAWSVIDPRPDLDIALRRVASEVRDIPIKRVLLIGSPAEAIVDYAKDHDSDLIAMGTHGRSGFSHLLMGSVAEQVIRRASCPVMVVRQEKQTSAECRENSSHESSRHVIVV